MRSIQRRLSLGLISVMVIVGLVLAQTSLWLFEVGLQRYLEAGLRNDSENLLAALVRFHRKGLKLSELPALPNHDEQTVLRCIRILRLAVAAHHRRQDNLLPEWNVQAAGDQLVVTLPLDWCDENKLLMQNLEKEHRYCHEQGWPLLFQLG